MKCIVTAGPTYEPLDEVRRLTNFSTGKLGSRLADYLVAQGHEVSLFLGYYSVHEKPRRAQLVQTFTTTSDLRSQLQHAASSSVHAVFHVAAVSDFTFGKIELRPPDGPAQEVAGRKLSSRQGPLWVELRPAPKMIVHLAGWFPKAWIVGWKYEVEGDPTSALAQGKQQISDCQTQACVVNGPAYGDGFGLVTEKATRHLADAQQLYAALEQFVRRNKSFPTP